MEKEMWLIWKEPVTRRRYKIGILSYSDSLYKFEYVNPELDDAIKCGFIDFPGFDNVSIKYESKELFANILTRLPNKSRPDYLEILNAYNLNIYSDNWDILKATKGRLLTDNFEFVPSFDFNKIEFNVAGTRYSKDLQLCLEKNLISINDKLELELDVSNQYDENAIKVNLNKNGIKYHLGYVPRYYTKELADLLRKNVEYSAMIQSLNFESDIFDEDITSLVKLIFNK